MEDDANRPDKNPPLGEGEGVDTPAAATETVSQQEQPPETVSQQEKPRLLFSKDLETVGLAIFAITAVAIILYVGVFNIAQPEDSFRALRSFELLLTLGASGLVIALIGRAQNPFVLAFGIFLIGALIVPSNDIIRFALIASGSDRSYESLSLSTGTGADLAGRSTDVANKIITELSGAGFMETPSPARRKVAINIIEGEVRGERVLTLVEQVRARGAANTLNAAAGDINGWIYKYGKEQKFLADLKYLRSEDLIAFAYEDLETIRITPLGNLVLRKSQTELDGDNINVSERSIPDQFLPPGFNPNCSSSGEIYPDVSNGLLSPKGRLTRLEKEMTYLRLVIVESADYVIDVEVENEPAPQTVDPLIMLFAIHDNDCTQVDVDDDGGSNLNSRLFLPLEASTYLIGTLTLSSVEGDARVTVKKQ